MVSLLKAEATYELPAPPAEEVLGEESASSETSSEDDGADKKADDTDTEGNATKKTAKSKKEADKKKSKKAAATDSTLRKTLLVTENLQAVSPASWVPWMVAESKARLAALTAADEARRANEAALNELETYIYKVLTISQHFIFMASHCARRALG